MLVVAVSRGKVEERLLVGLCYAEDAAVQLVLAGGRRLIGVQATGEHVFLSPKELAPLIDLGAQASEQILAAQRQTIDG